jgi:hypothetical protein
MAGGLGPAAGDACVGAADRLRPPVHLLPDPDPSRLCHRGHSRAAPSGAAAWPVQHRRGHAVQLRWHGSVHRARGGHGGRRLEPGHHRHGAAATTRPGPDPRRAGPRAGDSGHGERAGDLRGGRRGHRGDRGRGIGVGEPAVRRAAGRPGYRSVRGRGPVRRADLRDARAVPGHGVPQRRGRDRDRPALDTDHRRQLVQPRRAVSARHPADDHRPGTRRRDQRRDRAVRRPGIGRGRLAELPDGQRHPGRRDADRLPDGRRSPEHLRPVPPS